MTDDIVTRLRLLSASQKAHRFADLLDDWSGEAANEIERLRDELAQAKKPKDVWHDCSHCQGHEPESVTND